MITIPGWLFGILVVCVIGNLVCAVISLIADWQKDKVIAEYKHLVIQLGNDAVPNDKPTYYYKVDIAP